MPLPQREGDTARLLDIFEYVSSVFVLGGEPGIMTAALKFVISPLPKTKFGKKPLTIRSINGKMQETDRSVSTPHKGHSLWISKKQLSTSP